MSTSFIPIQDILEWVQGQVANLGDLRLDSNGIQISRISPLGVSKPGHLAFFFSRAFESELRSASPSILITGQPFIEPLRQSGLPLWGKTAVIPVKDPYFAMALLSEKVATRLSSVVHLPQVAEADKPPEVHPTAVIADSAVLGSGVKVGAHCVIEAGAEIGANSILYPSCFVGPRCLIGADTVLFPGVKLYEWTHVGNRVRLHAGCVLGSDGFGYAPKIGLSREVTGHQKIYHLGTVVIEDDVEIGANSTVDRGTFGETRISRSSKIDNLVHIGHNSFLDEGAVICGGTCLAGHASIGRFATIGGLTGITNHVQVGDGAKVGALSLVTKDVPPGGTAVGNPQRTHSDHFRSHGLLSKLLAERRSKINGNDESSS